MQNYKIIPYSTAYYNIWNDFILISKNATFLFHRDFMDYHKDRFDDFSVLVFKKETLVAVLPGNRKENTLYSHQGLTYGGLLLPEKASFETVLDSLRAVLAYLKEKGIEKLIIKAIPKIYNEVPSDEMDYLLFILQAKLFRRDLSMAINLEKEIRYFSSRQNRVNKGKRQNLTFAENNNLHEFWRDILIPNLKNTHNADPTHSLEEIVLLKKTFPENIRFFSVNDESEMLAGCVVFETRNVAHLQYSSRKKHINKNALDLLINELITKIYRNKKYFDFGISNENQGMKVNLGLLNWKASFGSSAVVHDFYEVDLNNFALLDEVIL